MTTLNTDTVKAIRASGYVPVRHTRGQYDQLTSIQSGPFGVAEILNYVRPALPTTFCDFDRRGRGDALNVDLYGWDPDQLVAVVQVRQAFRQRASHYMGVHKDYVLCGFNEDGSAFRHPVSAAAVRGAIRSGATPAGVVHAAQRWMWGCTQRQLDLGMRQGDVLIVAERCAPRGTLTERGTEARLAETHVVRSSRIVTDENGRLYAVRPTLEHVKGQHRGERAPAGSEWCSVRVAATASAWDYSVRLGD